MEGPPTMKPNLIKANLCKPEFGMYDLCVRLRLGQTPLSLEQALAAGGISLLTSASDTSWRAACSFSIIHQVLA